MPCTLGTAACLRTLKRRTDGIEKSAKKCETSGMVRLEYCETALSSSGKDSWFSARKHGFESRKGHRRKPNIEARSVMMSSMLTGRSEGRRFCVGCLTSTSGVLPLRLPRPHRG